MVRKIVNTLGKASIEIRARQILTFYNDQEANRLAEKVEYKPLNLVAEIYRKQMQIMKKSAAQASACCLAANQVYCQIAMISLHKRALSQSNRNTQLKWIDQQQYDKEEDYVCFANPKMTTGRKVVDSQQESISFPFIHFTVKRYEQIQVSYFDENRKPIQRELKGNAAKAFQQGFDQLNGIAPLDWRRNFGNIKLQSQVVEHFQKSNDIIEEYSKELKQVFDNYPQLTKVEEYSSEKPPIYHQTISIEEDYTYRLTKYFNKQMALFMERISLGMLNPDYSKKEEEKEKKLSKPKVTTIK